MSSVRRQMLLTLLKLLDLTVLVSCFALATVPVLYESGLPFSEFFSMRVKVQNFIIFMALLLIWHLIFASCGLYASRRMHSQQSDVLDALMATSLCTLFMGAATIVVHIRMVDVAFLTVFWGASSAIIISSRVVLRYFLHHVRRQGYNLRQLLIIGTNPRALEFARKVESRPELGYRVIGFADREWARMEAFRKTGNRLVSDLKSLPEFIRSTVIDEVVIALPIRSFYFDASRMEIGRAHV